MLGGGREDVVQQTTRSYIPKLLFCTHTPSRACRGRSVRVDGGFFFRGKGSKERKEGRGTGVHTCEERKRRWVSDFRKECGG